MPLDLNKVHEFRKNAEGKYVLLRINHLIRLKRESEEPIYCQGPDGKIFTEGGQEIPREEVPDWFWSEASKVGERTRKACGLLLPGEEPLKKKSRSAA